MALSSATITYDIADLVGNDFDARRTKVWVSTNIDSGVISDTVGNQVRVGDGLGDIADDGTGSVSVWVPGTGSNPTTWQTYIHFDYAQRRPGGARERLTFGPFTITTSANLADLIQEQEVPPTYLSTVTTLLDGKVTLAQSAATAAAASAAAASALVISDLGTTDGQTRALLQNPASQTAVAEAANIAAQVGGYDVILLAGQSNMQGGDNTVDPTIDIADARIFEYALSGTNANTIQPALDPLHHPFGLAIEVGPGMAFARWYAANNPTRKVLLVPYALGSSGFEASTSSPNARWKKGRVQSGETNLYAGAVAATNAALVTAGAGSRPVAALWCQGEADGATASATYQADLLELVDGFRSDITGAANLPFVALSMVPEQWTGLSANAGRVTINNVHVDLPYLRERCGYAVGLTGHGVGLGGIHYDAVAQRYNGSVALPAAYERALANKKGTAPNAPTGVTVTQDTTTPTSANVTWNAARGRVTDYTVQYRTAVGEAWTTLTRTRSLATSATITGIPVGNYLEVQVLTVNENSTSAASTSRTASILPTPTIAVVQTAADTVTVTTTAVASASGYRVDYKLSASSTWTYGTPQAGLVGTVTGLGTSAYDFRVVAFTAIGAAIVAATSYTLSAVPINTASITATVRQAYGLRKVISGYAGNCIQVRYTDNTVADIGFNGNDLDVATIMTGVGAHGGGATIAAFYDQSGNTRHMLQATAAAQPTLVAASSMATNNGRPAIDFDAVDDYLERASADVYALGGATICGVASGTSTATSQECVFGEGGTGSNNAQYAIITKVPNAKFGYAIFDDTAASLSQDLSDAADTATFGSTATQWTLVDSGTLVTRYRGGTGILNNQLATSYSRAGKTLTLNRQTIGALHRLAVSRFAKVRLSELIILGGASVSTADRQFVEANQKAYYGTPTGL